MRESVANLHRSNIGQTLTLEILDDETGHESVVVGTLMAIERTADATFLTIGVNEYEMKPTDTVDMIRSVAVGELVAMRRAREAGSSLEDFAQSLLGGQKEAA